MFRLYQRLLKCKRGAALVEYALLVAGVALIGAASVSIFGHKTNDMIAMVAAVLPGAHADDNGPIISGKIIETANTAAGEGGAGIGLDITKMTAQNVVRLGNNVGTVGDLSTLVLEPAAP
jgi:pilus assembly protein Flp/PilA